MTADWNPEKLFRFGGSGRIAVEVTDSDYVITTDGTGLLHTKSQTVALHAARAIRAVMNMQYVAKQHAAQPLTPRRVGEETVCYCDLCVIWREEQLP